MFRHLWLALALVAPGCSGIAPGPTLMHVPPDAEPTTAAEFATVGLYRAAPYANDGLAITVCLAADGAITAVVPVGRTDVAAIKLAAAVKKHWSYLPLNRAVCAPQQVAALTAAQYASQQVAEAAGHDEFFAGPPPVAGAILVQANEFRGVSRTTFQGAHPTAEVAAEIAASGGKTTGVFLYCVDEIGRMSYFRVQRSTQWGDYDRRIALFMVATWQVRPILRDGKPVQACSRAAYTYEP